MQLSKVGWEIHYLNLANGCCGSMETDRQETARIRLEEAQRAAKILGAAFHHPICDDMAIFYTPELLAKVASAVRKADPQIVLTHALVDYMEDHQNAARLAVSATFIKFSPNFICDPPANSVIGDVAVYHAQPHGNCTPVREPVMPEIIIDCTDVIEQKTSALAAHASQKNWLDSTQKMNSYIQSMIDNSKHVAGLADRGLQHGEGWRRHLHLGFGPSGFDPLSDALGEKVFRIG